MTGQLRSSAFPITGRVSGEYPTNKERPSMRYFFDIHLNGECHLDEEGKEFRIVEEARDYVLVCARICVAEGTPADKKVMAQSLIEITDRTGFSDVVTLNDVSRPFRNPRRVLQRAAYRYGIG
jgi:hypothetical protein